MRLKNNYDVSEWTVVLQELRESQRDQQSALDKLRSLKDDKLRELKKRKEDELEKKRKEEEEQR